MSMRTLALGGVLVAALLIAGCSGPDQGTEPSAGTSSTGGTGGTDGTNPPAAGGQLPDACTLIAADRLGQLLGVSVGTGNSAGVSAERSICIYANGVITGVEVAANYDSSRKLIEDTGGRKTTDIAGLGRRAFHDEAGQVIASGDRVFVAVTASGVDQAKMVAVCKELLAAAGETP